MKTVLVCGAGGFIGGHLAKRLKAEGFWVRGIDLKINEYFQDKFDDFIVGDLRQLDFVSSIVDRRFDEVYQLAADMGGAGYISTGDNDADILHNSALINLNVLDTCRNRNIQRVFYSSSACVYPEHNQQDLENPNCAEDSVYPAAPDSEYGWEKLFSERLYLAYNRNHGMECRIARYHNIFGPQGTWVGGKEKVPAALCRKIAQANDPGVVKVWGDGLQTRSFLYIDECIEGTIRLLRSNVDVPINIGSDELISINELAQMIIGISGKSINTTNTPGPTGVRGRNSDNRLIAKTLSWRPQQSLHVGMEKTYDWINQQNALRGNQPSPLAQAGNTI